MSLPEKLLFLRKQNGFTQMELAEKLNVSRQAISRWEVGAALPSTDNLKTLGELYGVSVDYLLNTSVDQLGSSSVQNEQSFSSSISEVDKKKHLILYTSLISFLLIVIGVSSWFLSTHSHNEDSIPVSQMEEDVGSEYITYTFSIE